MQPEQYFTVPGAPHTPHSRHVMPPAWAACVLPLAFPFPLALAMWVNMLRWFFALSWFFRKATVLSFVNIYV